MNQEQKNQLKYQKKAGQLFVIISCLQLIIHLMAYVASFWKLIIIERGGYYNIGTIFFIGMSIISLPCFLVSVLLIIRSFRLSVKGRVWGYFFDVIVFLWSLLMVKVSYFM